MPQLTKKMNAIANQTINTNQKLKKLNNKKDKAKKLDSSKMNS